MNSTMTRTNGLADSKAARLVRFLLYCALTIGLAVMVWVCSGCLMSEGEENDEVVCEGCDEDEYEDEVVGGCEENVYTLPLRFEDSDTLDQLSGVTNITEDLLILDTDVTSLDELGCLEEVGRSLRIENNDSLEDIEGLRSLTAVELGVTILENESLENLDGLRHLLTTGRSITIEENDSITNLDGLRDLTAIRRNLKLTRNLSLTSIEGMTSLKDIGGYIHIINNPYLPTCQVESLVEELRETGFDGAASALGNNDAASCECQDDVDCDDGLICTVESCDQDRGQCVYDIDFESCGPFNAERHFTGCFQLSEPITGSRSSVCHESPRYEIDEICFELNGTELTVHAGPFELVQRNISGDATFSVDFRDTNSGLVDSDTTCTERIDFNGSFRDGGNLHGTWYSNVDHTWIIGADIEADTEIGGVRIVD